MQEVGSTYLDQRPDIPINAKTNRSINFFHFVVLVFSHHTCPSTMKIISKLLKYLNVITYKQILRLCNFKYYNLHLIIYQ